jgi:hypothetical protein
VKLLSLRHRGGQRQRSPRRHDATAEDPPPTYFAAVPVARHGDRCLGDVGAGPDIAGNTDPVPGFRVERQQRLMAAMVDAVK